MALKDVTRESVLEAVALCDELGEAELLARYGCVCEPGGKGLELHMSAEEARELVSSIEKMLQWIEVGS